MASKFPQFEGVDALKSEQRGQLSAMVDVMGHDSPDVHCRDTTYSSRRYV